jgi:hypothetical protein
MTRQLVAVLCSALLLSQALVAISRSSQADADPVTGTWTGEVVPDSGNRFTVTLQLKFDGQSGVSGTIAGLPSPVDVKSGTFNPKTGALKLPLGQVGDPEVLFTLDGTVVKDTATGRAIDSSGEGTFKIARKT